MSVPFRLLVLSFPAIPGGIGGNGNARWHYFKKVVAAPTLEKTGLAFNFPGMKTGEVWIALVTFLYVDFFGEKTSYLAA